MLGCEFCRGSADARSTFEHFCLRSEVWNCSQLKVPRVQVALNDRNVILVVPKKEQGFWPRLLADKHKVSNIQVDWDKWVDEDEEDEVETQDFDISNLQNLSKLGGGAEVSMEGDDSDSDDSDLPGLETA